MTVLANRKFLNRKPQTESCLGYQSESAPRSRSKSTCLKDTFRMRLCFLFVDSHEFRVIMSGLQSWCQISGLAVLCPWSSKHIRLQWPIFKLWDVWRNLCSALQVNVDEISWMPHANTNSSTSLVALLRGQSTPVYNNYRRSQSYFPATEMASALLV